MPVNSSSSSSPHSNSSSSVNLYDFLQYCHNTAVGTVSVAAFTVTGVLLVLPLCVCVVHLGFQRWRRRRRRSGWTASHSDVFTFHAVATELMNVAGCAAICCGVLARLPELTVFGACLFITYSCGQLLIHTLTCVERYLAAVHPVTYLGLRKGRGIRIRNVSVGCAWLASFANTAVSFVENAGFINIFYSCVLSFVFVVISFCSLSVLCVLIRPGPGSGGGARQRVDQSKTRAFCTIAAILGVLSLRVVGTVVNATIFNSPHVGESGKCSVWFSVTWFSLPSSLVLPLLFLHRAGKLLCCKNNQSGQGSD